MDAMTHSSADRNGGPDSGRSGDGPARPAPEPESQGGWGWFTKGTPASDQQAEPESAPDRGRPARPEDPAARGRSTGAIRPAGSAHDDARRYADQEQGSRDLAYGREVPLYGGGPAREEEHEQGYDRGYGRSARAEQEPEPPRWGARPAQDDGWAARPAQDDGWGVPSVPAPRPGDGYRRAPGRGEPASPPPAGGWFGSGTPVQRGPDGGARPAAAPQPERPRAHPAPPEPPAPPVEEAAGTASFGPTDGASSDAILIRRTMQVIEPVADKTTSYFYALVFLRHPELRELFPAAMDQQRDRLFRALLTAAKHVDDGETLTAYLANLGRGHRKYGTLPDHYPSLGECLIGALTRYASEMWNEEVEAAWVRAYTAISQIMIDAAAENERIAPAWWQAEIVSHERRTSDIAVITVRPDQPYPFLAGQYTSLETPWWPRVWRHYSFASAPRSDGLLSFHVRSVPAGWVSSAIVNRARPGDVIRLGPPAGSMTVDHDTDNGLLCLGGGTGIAPIKALVEDVVEHGRRRPVDVFYAARRDHDLYDLDTMLRMQERHPWLSVRPVVSDGPATDAGLESGPLQDVVARYGPWPAYDAYLSGPPGMIRSSVDALVDGGMPTDRIRHDSLEELVSARD